jgi:N-methylhydantoinase A
MQSEGFASGAIHHVDAVDMRYRGQSYVLTVSLKTSAGDFVQRFHDAHDRRFGYSTPDKPVEIVNVRTSFVGRSRKPQFKPAPRVRGIAKPVETALCWMNGRKQKVAVYDRSSLRHGHVIHGPSIVGEYSSTTLVPSNSVCKVDAYLNLVIS